MIQGQKTKYYIAGVVTAVILGIFLIPKNSYQYRERPLPTDFDAYYRMKREASSALGARPGTEERLIRKVPGKSKIAFLYIHGFGSCRGEGEEVIERLAERYNANAYFLRLPGHGTNMEEHAKATAADYLNEAEEAVRMMPLLGEKIVVSGTSMGGLLGLYVTAKHPDIVSAALVSSPFIDFASSAAKIAHIPGGITLATLIMGKIRDTSDAKGWEQGWQSCWYSKQYLSAVQSVADTSHEAAKDNIFAQIKSPVLMLYYYRDEAHQDDAASVKAMLEAFAKFGGKQANALNRAVAVPDGDHVLFSRYKKTDKDMIIKEAVRFLDQVQATDVSAGGRK
ncbi:MAG: alpha/beta hydrolase [Spirochaetia bacterium]|nr:alpha/beta hydrolase [Spirochaetia bacterium]